MLVAILLVNWLGMLIFQIDKVTFGFVGAVSQEQSDNVIH
jgi:hypothetical protein